MKYTALTFLFFLAFAGAPARADIDAAGAAHVKTLIEKDLQAQTRRKPGLAWKDITVAPKAGFYEARIANFALPLGDKITLNAATVILNIAPHGNGDYALSLALPPRLTIHTAAGSESGTVRLSSQRLSALWRPGAPVWPKMDALYDIEASGGANGLAWRLSVPVLRFTANLKDSGGAWTGANGFGAERVRIAAATSDGNTAIDIAKATGASLYRNLSADRAGDDAGNTLVAENLRMQTRWQNGQSDFALARAALNAYATNIAGNAARITFKGGFEGLRVFTLGAAVADLLPSSGNVDVTLENVPLEKMLAAALDPQSGLQPPDVLKGSGARATLRNTFLKGAVLQAAAEGHADMGTDGAKGHVTLSVKGLEEAIQKLKTEGAAPDAAPETLGLAGYLTGIALIGRSDRAKDGKTVTSYALDLMPDQRLLLNGVSIRALVQPPVKP